MKKNLDNYNLIPRYNKQIFQAHGPSLNRSSTVLYFVFLHSELKLL